jgi:hypothetical protein
MLNSTKSENGGKGVALQAPFVRLVQKVAVMAIPLHSSRQSPK